jgi:hypothetical protein
LILQTGKALFAESSPPLPDDLRTHLEPAGDLNVGQSRRGGQHDLGALHVTVGKCQLRSPSLEFATLLLTERDLDRRRHRRRDSPPAL